MYRRKAATVLVLLVTAGSAACDRTPVEPIDDSGVAALGLTGADDSGPLTVSGLLYSAIRTVHAEHGVLAAADLMRDLARIQHRLTMADVAERPALHREMREEQLRIVLLVHGNDVIERVVRSVRAEAGALLRRRASLAAAGIAAPELSAILEDVPDLLARARNASTDIQALDAATQAAARTDRMRDVLLHAARLPSLDELYDAAAAGLRTGGMHDVVVQSNALRSVAAEAVRSGERDRAHSATEAAREAQIRVVLSGLGPDAVADMIGMAQDRAADQGSRLSAASANRDVSRLERMNAAAADMLHRAALRLSEGESARALDLAGHAVDLLNAIEVSVTSR